MTALSLLSKDIVDYVGQSWGPNAERMASRMIPGGTVHVLPDDIQSALESSKVALNAWKKLTPLARNEWICWCTVVKRQQTRDEHVVRLINELKEGVRRPCCWIGCVHRDDKPVSKSVKAILARRGEGKKKEKEENNNDSE